MAGYDAEAASAVLRASDARWRAAPRNDPESPFSPTLLDRFAQALAFCAESPPRWTETVTTEGLSDWPQVEVRALTEQALLVVVAPWAPGENGPQPTVRIRPLRTLRGLEVDGFRFDADGQATGCTVALLFDDRYGVRLGGAPDADRRALAGLLPSLRASLGA